MTPLAAYRRTSYQAAGYEARIGRAAPELLSLLGGHPGVFITAWNPQSRRTPLGRNLRANRALERYLRRHQHWPGWGVGHAWREAHYLVRIDPRQALTLARRFRQAAVTLVSRRPTRLLLLR